jgi:hypothetical protein
MGKSNTILVIGGAFAAYLYMQSKKSAGQPTQSSQLVTSTMWKSTVTSTSHVDTSSPTSVNDSTAGGHTKHRTNTVKSNTGSGFTAAKVGNGTVYTQNNVQTDSQGNAHYQFLGEFDSQGNNTVVANAKDMVKYGTMTQAQADIFIATYGNDVQG